MWHNRDTTSHVLRFLELKDAVYGLFGTCTAWRQHVYDPSSLKVLVSQWAQQQGGLQAKRLRDLLAEGRQRYRVLRDHPSLWILLARLGLAESTCAALQEELQTQDELSRECTKALMSAAKCKHRVLRDVCWAISTDLLVKHRGSRSSGTIDYYAEAYACFEASRDGCAYKALLAMGKEQPGNVSISSCIALAKIMRQRKPKASFKK